MSGQPIRKPMDATKFRNEYLSSLQLQIANDDKNLQANKLFNRTQQLPTELTDYRTTNEKISDTMKLKLDVQSELLALTDSSEALGIVQNLSQDQLVFLAQNMEAIKKDVKKRFKYGLTQETFMPYFNRYIEKFDETNSINAGLQQNTNDNIIGSAKLLEKNLVNKDDIDELGKIFDVIFKQRDLVNDVALSRSLMRSLHDTDRILTTVEQINGIADQMDAITSSSLKHDMNQITQDLPLRSQFVPIVNDLISAVKSNSNDRIQSNLNKIYELLQYPQEMEDELNIISELIQMNHQQPRDGQDPIKEERKDELFYVGPPKDDDVKEELPKKKVKEQKYLIQSNVSSRNMKEWINDRVFPTLRKNRVKNSDLEDGYIDVDNVTKKEMMLWIQRNDSVLRENGVKRYEVSTKGSGFRMHGRGIGVPKDIKFAQFGSKLISKKQLGKGIVSLRYPCGASIQGLKVERVSPNCLKVVNSIYGGQLPSFEDFNNLSEEDKIYLHKLSNICDIEDRLKIPAPKLNETDKLVHRFDLLRGEIMAGNDSSELIKEFKMLIMKLSRMKMLPSGQVKSLLLELLELGY